VEAARGRYVVFVDDDAYMPDHAFSAMIEAFEEHRDAGGLAFRIDNPNTGEESSLLPTVFHGCACAFRRDVLEAVGGYPQGYGYYGEEYDLTFRLFRAGYRIILCNTVGKVRHVRDAGGRDKARIMYLLIRNNAFLAAAYFPWRYVWPSLKDVLQRYQCIAQKEQAVDGFKRGKKAAFLAILRGALHRQALSRSDFDDVALLSDLERVIPLLKQLGRPVVLCGVGRFPLIWLAKMGTVRVPVAGFADFNPCWQGASVGGVPVWVCRDESLPTSDEVVYLVGTSSLGDTVRWISLLQQAGLSSLRADAHPAVLAEAGNILLPVFKHLPVFGRKL
jgi:hypothetical protein